MKVEHVDLLSPWTVLVTHCNEKMRMRLFGVSVDISQVEVVNPLSHQTVLVVKRVNMFVSQAPACHLAHLLHTHTHVRQRTHTHTQLISLVMTTQHNSRGLGRRIHGSVEDTKLSTNKQHSLSPRSCASLDSAHIVLTSLSEAIEEQTHKGNVARVTDASNLRLYVCVCVCVCYSTSGWTSRSRLVPSFLYPPPTRTAL